MTKHENCKHLLGSLSEYVDGDLEGTLCAEIERHLADCEDCRIVVDTLNKTVLLYHQSAEQVTVPPEVRQRLFRCLDLEDYAGS
jgi:predicted anti-sigma-YlaC factor YlaD